MASRLISRLVPPAFDAAGIAAEGDPVNVQTASMKSSVDRVTFTAQGMDKKTTTNAFNAMIDNSHVRSKDKRVHNHSPKITSLELSRDLVAGNSTLKIESPVENNAPDGDAPLIIERPQNTLTPLTTPGAPAIMAVTDHKIESPVENNVLDGDAPLIIERPQNTLTPLTTPGAPDIMAVTDNPATEDHPNAPIGNVPSCGHTTSEHQTLAPNSQHPAYRVTSPAATNTAAVPSLAPTVAPDDQTTGPASPVVGAKLSTPMPETPGHDARPRCRCSQCKQLLWINLDGVIGCGKSTALETLRDNGYATIDEPLEEWGPLLEMYKRDPAQYGYPLQKEILRHYARLADEKEAGAITARCPSSARVFMQVMLQDQLLSPEQWTELTTQVIECLWVPDVTIHLQTRPGSAAARVQQRDQVGDGEPIQQYHQRLFQAYQELLVDHGDIEWGQIWQLPPSDKEQTVRQIQNILQEPLFCRQCLQDQTTPSCLETELVPPEETSSASSDDDSDDDIDDDSDKSDDTFNAEDSVFTMDAKDRVTTISPRSCAAHRPRDSEVEPGATPTLMSWKNKHQREFEKAERRMTPEGSFHSTHNGWHRPTPSTGFCNAVFLVQVVPKPPECGCPHELVYATSDRPEDTLFFHQRMALLATTRAFTSWGQVCWHTTNKTIECAALTNCRLRPYQPGTPPLPRAVLWGEPLYLAIFGFAPIIKEHLWQLEVLPRMAFMYPGTTTTETRGRAWFPQNEIPLGKEATDALRLSDNSTPVRWGDTAQVGPLLVPDGKGVNRQGSPRCLPPSQNALSTHLPLCESIKGSTLSLLVWNPRGLGRQLCSDERGQLLRTYLDKEQPSIIVLPEAMIPSRLFPKSRCYPEALRELALNYQYTVHTAYHATGQARMGLVILVKNYLQPDEVEYNLDLDNPKVLEENQVTAQWEGRALALRFQSFWLLGLYLPHNRDDRAMLLEQASAWMRRKNAPIILAGDMNAILDDLEQGVLVYPSGLSSQLPSNYFSRPDYDEKPGIMTHMQSQEFRDWLQEHQLEDVNKGGDHTTYFRIGFTLHPDDNPQKNLQLPKAAHQRSQQIATARIDGVFMNPAAAGMFQALVQHPTPPIQDGLSNDNTQNYKQATLCGLGSDHVPFLVALESKQAGTYCHNAAGHTGQTQDERVHILISAQRSRTAWLIAAAYLHATRMDLIAHWRWQAGLYETTTAGSQRSCTHRNRYLWRQVCRRAERVLLLRYWHLYQIVQPGDITELKATRWQRQRQQSFQKFVPPGYLETVAEVAQGLSNVPSGDELSPKIAEVVTFARELRFTSTVLCIPRHQRVIQRNENDKPCPRLWYLAPFKTRDKGWQVPVKEQYLTGVMQAYQQRWDAYSGLQNWKQQAMKGPEPNYERPPGRSPCDLWEIFGHRWGMKKPSDAIPLQLLLQQISQANSGMKQANNAWYNRRGTAGWAETLLYIDTKQAVDTSPPPPTEGQPENSPPETTMEIRAHQQQRRARWRDHRKAAFNLMCLGNREQLWGEIPARQELSNRLMEHSASKARAQAYWLTFEQQLQTHIPVVPAASTDDTESINMLWDNGSIHQTKDADDSLVNASDYGLDSFTQKTQVKFTHRPFTGTAKRQLYQDATREFHNRSSHKVTPYAECRKPPFSSSGLMYTRGQMSVPEVNNSQVWCEQQLWDTGSDFNVISGTTLARQLGPDWKQYVDRTPQAGGARMANGTHSQCFGTIVQNMDWTVALAGHTLTQSDFTDDKTEGCWTVVRIPVRFVVFENFDMEAILGMPMMSHMTTGMGWNDGMPASIQLHNQPSSETPRGPAPWALPCFHQRGTMPECLHVCVTEKAQWVGCERDEPVKTRIVGGAEMLDHGYLHAQEGWELKKTDNNIAVPFEYILEGVQHYKSLWAGHRRFTTTGHIDAHTPQECRQGIDVWIRGIPLDTKEDPEAFRMFDQHPGSPWLLDEEALLQPPATKPQTSAPVYIPAGTPVAWLEPRAVQNPQTVRLATQLQQQHSPYYDLLTPLRCDGAVYTQKAETTQYLPQNPDLELIVPGVTTADGQPVSAGIAQPEQYAKCWLANTHGDFVKALNEFWGQVASASAASQRWAARVLYQLVWQLTLASPTVPLRELWRNALQPLAAKSAALKLQQAQYMQQQIQEQLQREVQSRQLLEFLRNHARIQWMQRLKTERDSHTCDYHMLLKLLGEGSGLTRNSYGPETHGKMEYTDIVQTTTNERDRLRAECTGRPPDAPQKQPQGQQLDSTDMLFQMRESLHPCVTEKDNLPPSDIDATQGRLCLTQEYVQLLPSHTSARLGDFQRAHDYVQERVSLMQEQVSLMQEQLPRQEDALSEKDQIHQALNHITEEPERMCNIMRPGKPLSSAEKEAIDTATKQREALAERLKTDSAFENPLESVLENPITIPRYMSTTEHQANEDASTVTFTVSCDEVLGRLTPAWQKRIEQACSVERPQRGNVKCDQQARINRFAGYVASVSLHSRDYTTSEREAILDLILELEGFFNCDPNVPPKWTGGAPYSGLKITDGPPLQHQERRIPPLALPVVLEQIRSWLDAGIVEPSNSPHSSPMLVVAKKALAPPKDPLTGLPVANWTPKLRWRICHDFRSCNARLVPVNMTNAPRLELCLHQVASCGGRTFQYREQQEETGITNPDHLWLATTCDLVQGFHQITLAPECRPYTAFTIPGLHAKEGHLQFVCAPFGLSVMPTYFHEMVGQAIGDLHYGSHQAALLHGKDAGDQTTSTHKEADLGRARPVAAHYIDDTYASTLDTFEGHLQAVRAVFQRLEKVGFGARADKVEFAKKKLSMLGWSVEEGKITSDNEKAGKLVRDVGGIDNVLVDRKDVMSALGALNFYRALIPNAAGISAPLYQLTKKEAFLHPEDWTPTHSAALKALKESLLGDYFLAVPQEHKEFYLITDASVHSGAAVLAQVQPNGAEHPVSYAGTSFPEPARRWSPSERECFTLLWGAEYFNMYLKFSNKAVFCTDHKPLIGLVKASARSANSKLARWATKLATWSQAKIVHRAGVAMGPADMLSRLIYPAKEDTPDSHDNLQVHKDAFEPLENTDHWDGKGERFIGLPMQRLAMLKPRPDKAWISAAAAYRKATLKVAGLPPGLHEEDALRRAAQESKAQFAKRKDWFETGIITPEIAVKIISLSKEFEMTAEELGNGRYHISKWTDTRSLAPLLTNDANPKLSQLNSLEDKIVIWTECYSSTIGKLILDATGHEPEIEEQEYVCQATEEQDGTIHQVYEGPLPEIEEGGQDLLNWLQERGIYDAEDTPRDVPWLLHQTPEFGGEAPPAVNTIPDETTATPKEEGSADTGTTAPEFRGEAPTATEPFLTHTPTLSPEEVVTPLTGTWEQIRIQAMEITKDKCIEQQINNGQVPYSLARYIHALCNPAVSTIICQGGPGTGKTYTATLVGMLSLAREKATKMLHTKPLVSAGGASVGYERGSMADKLQYWTRPTRQAAERVAQAQQIPETDLMQKVEAYPIDRVRGLSIPESEWMIADEMQNTRLTLFNCLMTRAERGAKVVLCGDIEQCDLGETGAGSGMRKVVDSWRGLQVDSERIPDNPQTTQQCQEARRTLQALAQEFTYIELDNTCQMRNIKSSAFSDWMQRIESTRKQTHSKATEKGVSRITLLHSTTSMRIPTYSAYAGLDNLGHGAQQGCPELQSIGGSENDPSAREAFRRRHAYSAFSNQKKVPTHMLEGVYVVFAGAPCIAYSQAGNQRGATDPRGNDYETQIQRYTDAQVPIIVLEQVTQVQQISPHDLKSYRLRTSPQQRVVDKLQKAGYHLPDGTSGRPGQQMNAVQFGGTVDRDRLITIAVRRDVWEQQGHRFHWPPTNLKTAQPVSSIMDHPERVPPHLIQEEPNRVQFEEFSARSCSGRAKILACRRGRTQTLGHWDNPDKIYSTAHPMPSPTASGNTRWYPHPGPQGEEYRRRLAPWEVARAMGIDNTLIRGLGEKQGYRLTGNAVPLEIAIEIGKAISQLINPELAEQRVQDWTAHYEERTQQLNKDSSDVEVSEDSLRRQMWQRMRALQDQKPPLPGMVVGTDQLHQLKGHDPLSNEEMDQIMLNADMDGIWALLETTQPEEATRIQAAVTFDAPPTSQDPEIREDAAYINQIGATKITDRQKEYGAAQELDTWCQRLRHYLKTQKHQPLDDQQTKTGTIRDAANYVLMDGLLYRKSDRADGPGLLLCTPSSLRDALVRLCHQSSLAIHPQAQQMYGLLHRRHYWPELRLACENYVLNCSTCQKAANNPLAGGDQTQYVPVGKPLSVVAIDVVGPLGHQNSTTRRGHRHIVTCIDWFTRYVAMYAVPEPTAEVVGACLEKFVARFGVPRTIISDNAGYFKERAIRALEKRLGVRRAFVSAHRAAGNGLLERFHRTLGRALKVHVHDAGHTDWDEGLDLLGLAYNSMEHSATGYSPHYLMHGYHPALPFDVTEPTDEDEFISPSSWVREAQQRLNRAHALAYEKMQDAGQARFTRRRKQTLHPHHIGDRVFLHIPAVPRGFVKKCTFQWHGPFYIEAERMGRCYQVRTHNSVRRIHESRLKRATIGSDASADTTLESTEVQLEFEKLLDCGAAAGKGWEHMAHILAHSDLHGPLPLEGVMPYRLTYMWANGTPYRTAKQQDHESTEPRLDPLGEEDNSEIQLDQAINEAVGPSCEYEAPMCDACGRIRDRPKGHHSLCPDCVLGEKGKCALPIDRWYRRAECRNPGPGTTCRGWKIRHCANAHCDQEIYVPHAELQQSCRGTANCKLAGTQVIVRTLHAHHRYAQRRTCRRGDDIPSEPTLEYWPPQTAPTKEQSEPVSDEDTNEPTPDRIPQHEIEEIPRTSDVDATQWAVQRIRGCQVRPCRYLVQWTATGEVTSSSWETAEDLFASSEAVITYWESPAGVKKAHQLATTRASDTTQQTIAWNYQQWAKSVTAGTGYSKEVAYFFSVQLTETPHSTQHAFKTQLEKGQCHEQTKFTVWVVPTRLCTSGGSPLVPLEITYKVLRRLVHQEEWAPFEGQLTAHLLRIGLGSPVGMFWPHKIKADEERGFIRSEVGDSVTMDSILRC